MRIAYGLPKIEEMEGVLPVVPLNLVEYGGKVLGSIPDQEIATWAHKNFEESLTLIGEYLATKEATKDVPPVALGSGIGYYLVLYDDIRARTTMLAYLSKIAGKKETPIYMLVPQKVFSENTNIFVANLADNVTVWLAPVGEAVDYKDWFVKTFLSV